MAEPTLTITGYYDPSTGRPGWFAAEARFDTEAEAEAFAAQFPKSHKFRAGEVTNWRDRSSTGVARSSTKLAADDINGGANETGIKRYRSILRKAEQLGVAVEYNDPGTVSNVYRTRDDFHAAIGL